MEVFIQIAQPTLTPEIATPTKKPIVRLNQNVLHNVPFTSQSPFAEWDNDIFQYGCEEASLLMAMHWVKEKPLSVEKARAEILAMAEFQNKKTYALFSCLSSDDDSTNCEEATAEVRQIIFCG